MLIWSYLWILIDSLRDFCKLNLPSGCLSQKLIASRISWSAPAGQDNPNSPFPNYKTVKKSTKLAWRYLVVLNNRSVFNTNFIFFDFVGIIITLWFEIEHARAFKASVLDRRALPVVVLLTYDAPASAWAWRVLNRARKCAWRRRISAVRTWKAVNDRPDYW